MGFLFNVFPFKFSTVQCQIQSFHHSMTTKMTRPSTGSMPSSDLSGSAATSTTTVGALPSVGPARHRNGICDDFSFLLTNPGLQKTYRIRPIVAGATSTASSTTSSSVGNSGPMTPTPNRRRQNSRSFFTLSRKDSNLEPLGGFYYSLRGRGSSAPMLPTTPSSPLAHQSMTMQPLVPRVEDWVRALQTVLANLQLG